MKLVFSSERSVEPEWVHQSLVEPSRPLNFMVAPNKGVLKLIQQIEQGNFPIISVTMRDGYYLAFKKDSKLYEAYFRMRISLIPILVNEEDSERDDDNDSLPEEE